MKVIINADDFGFDSDTVAATIDGFRRGIFTSATIMPNMPATAKAIEFARQNPQFSFGVHLTYSSTTWERPICDPSTLPSLTDKNGNFWSPNKLRAMALFGRVSTSDIERETMAQLEFMLSQGFQVSHVDSHGHLHKFVTFQSVLENVLPRFSLRRVRTAQNLYAGSRAFRPTSWFSTNWGDRIRERFATTAYMYMPAGPSDKNWWNKILDEIPPDVSLEVGVHPGGAERWRQEQCRDAERFAVACRNRCAELVTWLDIPECSKCSPS